MLINDIVTEAMTPFHVKYGLQGYDPANPLHRSFQAALNNLRQLAASMGKSSSVSPPAAWKIINHQDWRSAISGKPFTPQDQPSAAMIDPALEFTDDNLRFITRAEQKALGYQRRVDRSSALRQQGMPTGYDPANPLHAAWLKNLTWLRYRVTNGNTVQGIKPMAFDISQQQAWDLIHRQAWTSAETKRAFDSSEDSPSLARIRRSGPWTVDNVRYVTKAENHPRGEKVRHTLPGFTDDDDLHVFFVENFRHSNARADAKGIAFTITVTEAWDMINQQGWRCALTGMRFSRTSQYDPQAPSMDQINPRQGYTPDNVQYLTWLVNNSKAALDNQQYRRLCQMVIDHSLGHTPDPGERSQDPYGEYDRSISYVRGGKTFARPRVQSKFTGLDLSNPFHRKIKDIYINASGAGRLSPRRSSMTREVTLEGMLTKARQQDWRCALTGAYLTTSGANMISIDRIDPHGGYSDDNIQFTTWTANRAKTNMTMEEFLDLCRAVVQHGSQG